MQQPLRILYGDLYMVKGNFCNMLKSRSGHEFIILSIEGVYGLI